MVIQAGADARLWGWAKPGRTVTVTTSWSGAAGKARTGADGRWEISVRTPEAGYTPLSITFDDGEPLTVSDVLAGEVWVAAGQSNMEMPVAGFDLCPVEDYNAVVADAAAPSGVRYVKIPSRMSMTPLDDAPCEWRAVTPATVGGASATGYFFARALSRYLGVPVGMVEANKGGTRVESWLSADNLRAHTDEPTDSVSVYAEPTDYYRPMVWGNGTFSPILGYTARGILYYQGCSNVGYHTTDYARRLSLLARQWREGFGRGEDMPFYLVEIAPYFYDDDLGTEAALLREQQHLAARTIPHSGIVGTNDCAYPWERRQIHPSQKRKVGERLAWLALGDTYGAQGLVWKSPSYESMSVEGDKVYVRLRDTARGVQPLDGITGFEVAGADGVFHTATAYADWARGIVVSAPEVSRPVAVRYCFHNFALGNLRNQGGLPLLPFRSDAPAAE